MDALSTFFVAILELVGLVEEYEDIVPDELVEQAEYVRALVEEHIEVVT